MADQNKEFDPNETLTMEEWEKQLDGLFVDYDPKRKLKRSEIHSANYVGIDKEFRTDWLQRNGYELTRENYINADLPTVNPENIEESE